MKILAGKVVVGHAVHNDFKALQYCHPKALTRDTSHIPLLNRKADCPENATVSLKRLTKKLLNRDIQVAAPIPGGRPRCRQALLGPGTVPAARPASESRPSEGDPGGCRASRCVSWYAGTAVPTCHLPVSPRVLGEGAEPRAGVEPPEEEAGPSGGSAARRVGARASRVFHLFVQGRGGCLVRRRGHMS